MIARYRSCPAVSQICALTVFPSTVMERVANSTPIVDFESKLNSFRVNRESTARSVNMSHHARETVRTISVKKRASGGQEREQFL